MLTAVRPIATVRPMSAAPWHPGTRVALRFVRLAREDPALGAKLRELDPEEGLEPVLELAAREGFAFGVEELRAAHLIDWGLRSARYSRVSPPKAASTVAVVNRASSSI